MRIFANANYNFIKWRWHAIAISAIITIAGIVTILVRGLPLGVDFSGGTVLTVKFAQATNEDAVRRALGPLSSEAQVQTIGDPGQNEILIRLPLRPGQEQGTSLDQDSKAVKEALGAANLNPDIRSTEIVGPAIGADLKRKGVLATLTALGGLLVYIAFRFRPSFGIGAIAATFHDILITLVMLTWFGYDLSLNVIAAILTITGYSVNDTIVVFDRVRENQRIMRREPLDQIVNKSVNQTLGRTVITSGMTFLAVIALYLFGGTVLRGLSFTLLIGIITGTYSTVFIAASIAIILSRRGPQTGVTVATPAAKSAPAAKAASSPKAKRA
jgi:preprotein translocase subunit SecF